MFNRRLYTSPEIWNKDTRMEYEIMLPICKMIYCTLQVYYTEENKETHNNKSLLLLFSTELLIKTNIRLHLPMCTHDLKSCFVLK